MKFTFSIVLLTAFVFLAGTQVMAEDAKQADPAVAEQKTVEPPPTETSDVAASPATLAEFADATTNATEPQKPKEEKPADNSTKTSRR
uniref:Uncharacterized protein n=1 Tax=Glossina palpalis gambiensis TaxID=67801 RepID=A0A1B0ATZ7_9MUSC